MGVLTKEMTRLCGEIGTLRGARQGVLSRLRIEVAKSRKEVRAEIAAARRAWLGIVPAGPRAIRVQERLPVEAVAEAQPEREEAEIPEEAAEPGIEEGEAGAAAAPETRFPKKRKKKR